jgi:hypothetical protein
VPKLAARSVPVMAVPVLLMAMAPPQSKWAVNFEWLPVASPQDRAPGESVEQALLDWRAARKAHDVAGEAEARAGMASIRREVASDLPENGLPPQEQLAPGRLREAIIGDWESPFLSISIPRRRHARCHYGRWRGTGGSLVSGSCRTRSYRCHGRVDGHRRVGRSRRIDARYRRPGAESPALASVIFSLGSWSSESRDRDRRHETEPCPAAE